MNYFLHRAHSNASSNFAAARLRITDVKAFNGFDSKAAVVDAPRRSYRISGMLATGVEKLAFNKTFQHSGRLAHSDIIFPPDDR